LIHISRHDALTIVIAAMSIPVVLVLPAKLEDVTPVHHRQIVTEDVVFTVPIPLTGILRTHAIWNQSAVSASVAARLTANFQRSAQTGKLRWRSQSCPFPEIA